MFFLLRSFDLWVWNAWILLLSVSESDFHWCVSLIVSSLKPRNSNNNARTQVSGVATQMNTNTWEANNVVVTVRIIWQLCLFQLRPDTHTQHNTTTTTGKCYKNAPISDRMGQVSFAEKYVALTLMLFSLQQRTLKYQAYSNTSDSPNRTNAENTQHSNTGTHRTLLEI